MERRLLLAIALMVGVMILSNVFFPPSERPPEPVSPDSVATQETTTAADELDRLSAEERAAREVAAVLAEAEETPAVAGEVEETAATAGEGSIVTVRSELYEYRFDTRGARLVGATMLAHENFAEGGHGGRNVELVRPDDSVLAYALTLRGDTVSLGSIAFTASTPTLEVRDGPAELRFEAAIGEVTFDVSYRFQPDDYRIEVSGGLRGLGDVGHVVLVSLGRGIERNEAVPREDRAAMALVTRSRSGQIAAERLDRVDIDETRPASGAPFSWVASKSKYWLAAVVAPPEGPGIGGVMLRGVLEEDAAEMQAALPVPAGTSGFEYAAYIGPQDFSRLQAMGQELHNVNPVGWRWLRWFTRPFGNLIVAILIWMHESFTLAYGWVLILFGVGSRIVLSPLFHISGRAQMKQMALQPEIEKLKQRYKDDPQRLQQEQMKLFREHGVNPLGGCLPMFLPLPILITLFFVFQNTIEFRGVPFLWLPDLSLRDPLFIVPVLMGGSMLGLNWITQRGIQTNAQMKMISYVLPVVFTFFFANFAAGLNLYYTASNIMSLPQQMYLSRARRKAQPPASRKKE
ncbi:membrane protein insertase YidC [Candidatus Palauibacter polyketidifaciens]|uniref:membrane protein insertase YidC n=1 Tax=Candidatus Palauibacter polyketidifaciens TaxID=3056740 RepID=UPI0023A3391F|nr:membrane protein insertase YidC [Candidatus Palauibacter polyketidifaciens]MDE2719157.1 membrane protein insertase YidC [Candidatus Palauibacter polyketidifaciens]